MKAPTAGELLMAKAACIADEKTAEWHQSFSHGLANAIKVSNVLSGTIFIRLTLALGVEMGMRIMEARARTNSTNESDAELKRRVGL